MAQALVDATRIYPQEIGPMLMPAFKVFKRYFNLQYQDYCASECFDGNNGIYYDDNAQLASAYITVYKVTCDC